MEDRLAHKFDDLQMSREDHQAGLFDQVARSIEVLMKGVPEAHSELIHQKELLDRDLEEETLDIEREASYAKNEIHRDAIYQSRGFKAMWDYREVYEEIIMEVMQKYNLIPMRKPQESQFASPSEFMSAEDMQREIDAMQPSVPIPPAPEEKSNGKKKPGLSFKKKRGENQPQDFNL